MSDHGMTAEEYEDRIAFWSMQTSDEIEREITAQSPGILATILYQARKEASEASIVLADIDPTDVKAIVAAQNAIHRNRDMVRWLQTTIAAAKEIEIADLEEQHGFNGVLFNQAGDRP